MCMNYPHNLMIYALDGELLPLLFTIIGVPTRLRNEHAVVKLYLSRKI